MHVLKLINTNCILIYNLLSVQYLRKVSGQAFIYFVLNDNIQVLSNTTDGSVDP